MSSMDPMREDSSSLSESMRRISLRPYRFKQVLNTKSLSLTKLTTQPQMFNSAYGLLLRNSLAIADSSSPATTKTKSYPPSTLDAQSLTSPSEEKTDKNWQLPSLPELSILTICSSDEAIAVKIVKISKYTYFIISTLYTKLIKSYKLNLYYIEG